MAAWIILLAMSIIVFVFVVAFVLAKLFLKADYALGSLTDRGISKYRDGNGRGIVYEPGLKTRKYIRQYVIYNKNGKTELICKIAKKITFIDYDVVVFNNQNKILCVMGVREIVDKTGYSKRVTLPDETAYVSVMINEVDNQIIGDEKIVCIKRSNLIKFATGTFVAAVLELLCVALCLSNLVGGVFRESYVFSSSNLLVTLFCAIDICVVICASVFIFLKLKEKKR